MTITKFDRAACQTLRNALALALAQVEADLGITIQVGNMRFDANTVKIAATAAVAGGLEAKASQMLALYAPIYGIDPEKVGPGGAKLVDFNTKARTAPFIFERDGKRYKCSPEPAKFYFGKAA